MHQASGEVLRVNFKGPGLYPPPSDHIFITGLPTLELISSDFSDALAGIGAHVLWSKTMRTENTVGALVQLASIAEAEKAIAHLDGGNFGQVG